MPPSNALLNERTLTILSAVHESKPQTIKDLQTKLNLNEWQIRPAISQLLAEGYIVKSVFRTDRKVSYTKNPTHRTPTFQVAGPGSQPMTLWAIVNYYANVPANEKNNFESVAETLPEIFRDLYVMAYEIDEGSVTTRDWGALRKDLNDMHKFFEIWAKLCKALLMHDALESKHALVEYLLNDRDSIVTKSMIQELTNNWRKTKQA